MAEVSVKGGIKQEVDKKPFWVSDSELAGIKQTPDCEMSGAIVSGVPELVQVDKGTVNGAYTLKDGLLIYHFYKADRKVIYDDAHARMDAAPDQQSQIAKEANGALDEHPWWENTKELLEQIFTEHFKMQPHKVDYYPEADSWSVILPEPPMPAAHTPANLESPFAKLALQVAG